MMLLLYSITREFQAECDLCQSSNNSCIGFVQPQIIHALFPLLLLTLTLYWMMQFTFSTDGSHEFKDYLPFILLRCHTIINVRVQSAQYYFLEKLVIFRRA